LVAGVDLQAEILLSIDELGEDFRRFLQSRTAWKANRRQAEKTVADCVAESSTLQECDCCHDLFPLSAVEWTGVQMLCAKCKGPE
jgi:hypothetical protein